MKVSLNWLKTLVDLQNIPTADIIHQLTMCGLEVEEVNDNSEKYKGFIVALVKDKQKHPKADKLSLCTVFDGKEDLQVICGAPNVEAGQKVIFAPIGTVIPKGNFTIGKAKIRGIESNGMICAEDELELGDDHSGIIILPEEKIPGTPITEALGLDDVVMEIAITPNRPDALSHIGVARDLSAIFERQMKIPKAELIESKKPASKAAAVEIQDAENCPRYSAKVLLNIEVKESPEWLKEKISAIGLRPINNIVDVTNYIMYETGQPLHAFDLDMLAGNKIVVRSTKGKTEFTTLDSKKRELQDNTLLICDAEKPVAIAGVMGGENSEITSSTKNILIESAYFNPSSIRRTSKFLGLSTDASYRFERGTDPGNTVYAAERAAQLMNETGRGEILSGVIDVYPNEIETRDLTLRYIRIEKILGYQVKDEKVNRILQDLGMQILEKNSDSVKIKVPLARPDLEREVDLIEEVARINGYDNIPAVRKISITLGEKSDESSFAAEVREVASGLGFYEMINNPLQSEKLALMTGQPVSLLNPLSNDMACLRTSLLPGALSVLQRNIYSGEKNLAFFEIGNVFNKLNEGEIKTFSDFTETPHLLFILTGNLTEKGWSRTEKRADFYSLKGLINSFLSKIKLDNVLIDLYYHVDNRLFDFSFLKKYGEVEAGRGGRVKTDILKQFDIEQDVYCFEFDFSLIRSIERPEKKFGEPLRFPKVKRDFAFVFDKNTTFGEVSEHIKKSGSRLLKSVEIFDLFENSSIGEGKKSMAFSLEFYDPARTLTEEEVEKDFSMLISEVTKKFNAKLRGS